MNHTISHIEREKHKALHEKCITLINEEMRRRQLGGEPVIPNPLSHEELEEVRLTMAQNRPGIERQYRGFKTIKGLQEILKKRSTQFDKTQLDFTSSPTEREKIKLLGNMELEVLRNEIKNREEQEGGENILSIPSVRKASMITAIKEFFNK